MIGLQHRIFVAILLFCLFMSTESKIPINSAKTIIMRCIRNTICREFVSTTLGIGIGIGIDEAVETIFDRHGKKNLLSRSVYHGKLNLMMIIFLEDPLKDFFPITVTLKNSEFTVTRDEFTACHSRNEIRSYVDWKVEYICFFGNLTFIYNN